VNRQPARVGVLVPSNNVVLEPELYRHLPIGVEAHFARLRVTASGPEHVRQMSSESERAVGEMPPGLSVLVYACLSTSLVSPGWEARFGLLAGRSAGLLFTAASATVTALRALGAKRVAVVTPYPAAIDALVPDWLIAHGFEPVAHASMGIADIHEVGRRSPAEVARFARSLAADGADALCIIATDLRTLDAIAELERDLAVPVVTTNQALLWCCLRAVGNQQHVSGLGALFSRRMSEDVAP